MTSIVADDLGKDLASVLSEYLAAFSPKGGVDRKGTRINLDGLTNKRVKFLLHKFLYTKGLNDFGVRDTSGVFQIVHVRLEERREPQQENKQLMPYDPERAYGRGKPLYAPWINPSDTIEWEGKPPPGKKIRSKVRE